MKQLLDALIMMQIEDVNDKHGYHFERASEGYNGIVYRATASSNNNDYAVKIYRKSNRLRADREYQITKLLYENNLNTITPEPLHLYKDVEALQSDVLISRWQEGNLLGMPPSDENHETWHAILKTLYQLHTFTSDKSPLDTLSASSAIQNPIDMMAIIKDRFQKMPQVDVGHLSYTQIKTFVDAMFEQIPHHWQKTAPQTLIHGDCHTANMILHNGNIILIDWENAGISDPAFDISNMTSLWRFLDLSEEHHQWLVTTYAQLTGDDWLQERVSIYRKIQFVHWIVNYSRFIYARLNAPEVSTKQHRFSLSFQLKWQKRYYHKALQSLDI